MENKNKTYLFLDNDIYSPDEQTGTLGKEVYITKKDGDEVWFTIKRTDKRGYVVYPHLFAENTSKNRNIILDFKIRMREAKNMEKDAFALFKTISKAKF